MAENKKSFVLYADWIHTVETLSDDEAGRLIKHVLRYVNDLNPISDDKIVNLAFAPMKQQFKRDLSRWETIRIKRSEAGKTSADKRKQNQQLPTHVESVQQSSTNPTVNVNVNDHVNVNVNDNNILLKKESKFEFKETMIQLGFDEKLISEWLMVRKTKKATNTSTALKSFLNQVKMTKKDKNEVLAICIENSWSGFKSEWLNNIKTQNGGKETRIDAVSNYINRNS